MDSISARYVALAFGIERHAPGFVDAYFGPPEHREGALAGSLPTFDTLVNLIAALRTELRSSNYPERRKGYIGKQLDGMHTTVRALAGEAIPYRDFVRGCFDIEPRHTPEAVFEEAIDQLDALLPGTGSIQERMEAWKRRFEVPTSTARALIDQIADEARRRTAALVQLPTDEAVEFALVRDKPWSGYNWYLGGHRSLVEINTDLPIRASTLPDLVCHEAYPGHHTEHAIKELELYAGQGWGEHTIQLINTPECVISEGIATLAETIIFQHDLGDWLGSSLFPAAGIDADPALLLQIGAASRGLAALSGNAALLLHEQGAAPDEVVAYIMRYGLRSEREARQSLRFLSDPLWRGYIFTYFAGRELLGRWIDRGDRRERFVTLLREQVYPSLVEQWVLEEERNCVKG